MCKGLFIWCISYRDSDLISIRSQILLWCQALSCPVFHPATCHAAWQTVLQLCLASPFLLECTVEQVGCQDLSVDQQRKSYWKSLMEHFLSKLLGCIKILCLLWGQRPREGRKPGKGRAPLTNCWGFEVLLPCPGCLDKSLLFSYMPRFLLFIS